MNIMNLAEEIINGYRLERDGENEFLLTADLESLCRGADMIRRRICGNGVEMCCIINGKSGRCSENCKFCAQSAHNHTSVESYDFLEESKIADECRYSESKGVSRFSIVTAGKNLNDSDFEKAISAYEKISGGKIKICASHGLLTKKQFCRLKNAGVSRYHCNLETSRRFFPNICTSHTYDDKIKCIRIAQKCGLSICSGGIIGMGETWEDRIDMAFELAKLQVDSIPLNVLIPIKGTPLGNSERLSEDDILRTAAIFRFINPTAYIRFAAGRAIMPDLGQKAFHSGMNAMITGDMLTTTGSTIDRDKEMINGALIAE